jgi:hypothetical protein
MSSGGTPALSCGGKDRGRNCQKIETGLDMGTDIDTLTPDMFRFTSLLRIMELPQLAQNYENLEVKLRTDSSTRAVNEAREWVSRSFGKGSGSLSDRYAYREGSVDDDLNAEYDGCCGKKS